MKNQPTSEVWKALKITDIPKLLPYKISNHGRLKLHIAGEKEKFVNASNIKGYPIVSLKLSNKQRITKYVHKLTAEHFIEKSSPSQKYVIHLDYDKANNNVSNLQWVDPVELKKHQAKNPNYKKGIIRNAKLNEEKVRRLKLRLQQENTPLYKLAKEFGITHTQLNRIRSGKNWGNVTIEEKE